MVRPDEALCQGACVRNKRAEPVITGALEAFVTAYQRASGGVKMPVGEPSGRKVACIGAGPSSLACAELLVKEGHEVTIFEALPEPGGLADLRHPQLQAAQRNRHGPRRGPTGRPA